MYSTLLQNPLTTISNMQMSTQPNIPLLKGLVADNTFKKLLAGERLTQMKAYKRTVKRLRADMGDTEETQATLEAIKPTK